VTTPGTEKKMGQIALLSLIRIDSNDVFFYTCRAFKRFMKQMLPASSSAGIALAIPGKR
jgi:hypothetical protein